MNVYASTEDSFSSRMEALWEHIETEFHFAVGYVDRVVVPEVRRETGTAARKMARCLDRLADRLQPMDAGASGRQDGTRGL
jgi:hypothetical protein